MAGSHPIGLRIFFLTTAVWLSSFGAAEAMPHFARSTGLRCTACHVLPPKLNSSGEAFFARGYRLPSPMDRARIETLLVSAWMTGRHEERLSADFDKTFVPKVELISGGPIGELPLSFFIEWRVVSLETRGDGSLRDRGGRFEDAFINWQMTDRAAFTLGQFRAVNQVDVSRRLSVSEPALFSTSLAGEPSGNPRIQSLRAFSPAGRSPGFSFEFQSVAGDWPSDGLFHYVTVPFVGELSLPLSDEARREASFELRDEGKGVFLETFYRRRLNSVGVHAFIDDDRWLVTGVGTVNYKDFYVTSGVGVDDATGRGSRMRYSAELEYLPTWVEWMRPGVGFRFEHVTNANRQPAYIPYFVLSGPNTKWTFLLQLEYRIQHGNRAVFLDFSTIF
jgi:hypothetical protein